jgi:phage/plasmid-like protein (TIGR03299 family)
MAHEIDQTTGTAAVFTAGTPPWHGLGRNVQEALNSEEAIRCAGLDWHVSQWPICAVSPDNWGSISARDFVANVRDDTKSVLGVVGKKYRPFQNQQAFAFADAVVGEGMARYETAGALRGGRRVWMLLKLPDQLRVGEGDELAPYLLVYNSFDGSSCLKALLTAVRVVCQNTLNLALRHATGDGVTIRHRGDLQDRVEQARVTLGLVQRRLKNFSQEIQVMRGVSMSNGRLSRYFDSLLAPLSSDASDRERGNRLRALDRLNTNFADDTNTLPGMRGSLWAALNAATEFADHHRRFRGTGGAARAENRLDSIWFGSSNHFKQAAYRSALELAGLN